MKVLICGVDGYLGRSTREYLLRRNHQVYGVDDLSKRSHMESLGRTLLFDDSNFGDNAEFIRASLLDQDFVFDIVGQNFDAIIHYAEQPSAPLSMLDSGWGSYTVENNLLGTLNLLHALKEKSPETHLIKLGTMGEYGTPNIDIEEGWIDIHHNGRKDRFLFPRQASSLYHTSKILDTDLIWFFVRTYGLRVTDLMQGPVYGISLDEQHNPVTHLAYDDIFGTVLNRFLVQAAVGVDLTVYGRGGQTRGYIDLRDSMACVELAMENPPELGALRIFNQFTETFSVSDLADRVAVAAEFIGRECRIGTTPNPRKESEDHYYNPKHTGLTQLGLEPHFLSTENLAQIIDGIISVGDSVVVEHLRPSHSWVK